ncbi:hypothetical protein EAS54_08845 [Bradyrhizobium guangzhouense]|nr:hypothetical protein EAS54_08845 [Bradyrhizobium guangzhouense]
MRYVSPVAAPGARATEERTCGRWSGFPAPCHCEELLRRSNPDYLWGKILDCFAALAMTMGRQARASRQGVRRTAPAASGSRAAG